MRPFGIRGQLFAGFGEAALADISDRDSETFIEKLACDGEPDPSAPARDKGYALLHAVPPAVAAF
jgi:hypothetical protein